LCEFPRSLDYLTTHAVDCSTRLGAGR